MVSVSRLFEGALKSARDYSETDETTECDNLPQE
jgi:hypothetical protein